MAEVGATIGEMPRVSTTDQTSRRVAIVLGIVGLVLLAWSTAAIPVSPAISMRGIPAPELTGVIFFTCLTLIAASGAIHSASGSRWLVAFVPIVASTVLGGPTAGAWVAYVGSTEVREIREVPWYGTFANHSMVTAPAIAGGLIGIWLRPVFAGYISDPVMVDLLVGLSVAVTCLALNGALAIATVAMRQRRSVRETARAWTWPPLAMLAVVAYLMVEMYVRVSPWTAALLIFPMLSVRRAGDRDQAHWAAGHDHLTGLVSRRGFERALQGAVHSGAGQSALLMIDLDGFKGVNDTYGHQAGDELLRAIAGRLRSQARDADVAARLGGDEFALILRGIRDPEVLLARARAIRTALMEPMRIGAVDVRVGASVGGLLIGAGGGSDSVAADADQAMYASKRCGDVVIVGSSSLVA